MNLLVHDFCRFKDLVILEVRLLGPGVDVCLTSLERGPFSGRWDLKSRAPLSLPGLTLTYSRKTTQVRRKVLEPFCFPRVSKWPACYQLEDGAGIKEHQLHPSD